MIWECSSSSHPSALPPGAINIVARIQNAINVNRRWTLARLMVNTSPRAALDFKRIDEDCLNPETFRYSLHTSLPDSRTIGHGEFLRPELKSVEL